MSSNCPDNDRPVISVVMSVYNNVDYLDKAIGSILSQSFGNFEFIIFEDCSSDGSFEKLREYSSRDRRIILIPNELRQGLTKNLNRGLKLAKGDFIARMDSDDCSFPDRFERQLACFVDNPETVLVGSSYYIIDETGKRRSLNAYALDEREVFWIGLFAPPLMHSSAMFRCRLVRDLGLAYNESFLTAQDFELWSKMMRLGKCTIVKQPLIEYRRHKENISATGSILQRENACKIARSNIRYHFPDLDREHSELFDRLASFLYSGAPFEADSINYSVQAMSLLIEKYTRGFTSRQRKRIRMLAARWMVKALLMPDRFRIIKSLKGLFLLRSYFYPIISEGVEYLKRRFLTKLRASR